MTNFERIAKEFYLDSEHNQLDRNKLTELRDRLKSTDQCELVSIEDHKEYLLLLSKFRQAIAETEALNGENFNKTLTSLLSVGADGLYTNDLRFIFELIQNVDDCDYKNSSDCELDMRFDFNEGTITLRYNEAGFTPFNVFSITGIAEAAKNISPEKIEIGEKGIGFKSVFGVADKVLIQSGKFSFVLHEENFTVPEISYDSFDGIDGTKLVLYVKPENDDELDYVSKLKNCGKECRKIYTKIVEKYCTNDALFNNNPILFLKQLTKIRLYVDGFDSLEFTASKGLGRTNIGNDIYREENVVISSVVSSREKNIENQKTKIICTRYTMPIVYDRDMCVSRYGEKTAFSQKRMFMQLVTPNPNNLYGINSGTLYSFLPTQIRTSVPISCHIPFKLDSSREYIDDQKENLWFKYSRDQFAKMLGHIYLDLATNVKNEILSYLPTQRNYFFKINNHNDKTNCLKNDCFSATKFLELPVFYTVENNYKNCNETFCFSHTEPINDPIALCLLMNYKKELFIPSQLHNCNVSLYGIEIVKRIHFLLFGKALQQPSILKDVLEIIDFAGIKYNTLLEEVEKEFGEIKMPYKTIVEISKYPKLFKAFNALTINKIKEKKLPIFRVDGIVATENIKYIVSKDEPIDGSELDDVVNNYLKSQNYLFAKGALSEGQHYFIGKNMLLLSAYDTLDSFAVFARDLGKNDYFSAKMQMRAASLKLNDADNSMPVNEYMKLLREVREAIKSAFGKKHYDSYIKVIRELNSDPKRFLRELLQNADDCKYDEGVVPCFKLNIEEGVLTTQCNEKGFTKDNARAITAIGESTKKRIYSDNFEIGEKGIGFKTVFAVADEVEIHSNEFNFSLAYATPTIPKILSSISSFEEGTMMRFRLRDGLKLSFSKEEALSLCLGLHNLKEIVLGNTCVKIEDINNQRIITVNDSQYVFDVFKYKFEVTNILALRERVDGGKIIDKIQEITYYISEKSMPNFKYKLYAGLPTEIEFAVPFVIDAPFELTASRDDVLQNNWNTYIRQEMYKGYIKMLEEYTQKYRIEIMKFIRILPTQYGSVLKFSLFKNASEWFDDGSILERLKTSRIISTYDKGFFTMPRSNIYRYPSVIHSILAISNNYDFPKTIIDDPDNTFNNVLKNLGCQEVSFSKIADIICENDTELVKDEKLIKSLYKYLYEMAKLDKIDTELFDARIIPIKGMTVLEKTKFISYDECKDNLFVEPDAVVSSSNYKVLDTSVVKKDELEAILGINIRKMDSVYKTDMFKKEIVNIILSNNNLQRKYAELVKKLSSNKEYLNGIVGTLLQYKDKIPFKMEDGSFRAGNVFIVPKEQNVFNGHIINSHIIAQEALSLARMLQIKDIATVDYEDLNIAQQLTADDIEDLQSDYIRYGNRILGNCISHKFISDDLVEKYGLNLYERINYSGLYFESDFPSEPVKNVFSLRSMIKQKAMSVRKIIKVEEVRIVHKVKLLTGKEVLINSKEIRENTMQRYRPDSNSDACFCQMCRDIKGSSYIETNNIFLAPEYYWPQTRVALCLDCSKKFTLMRSNSEVMDRFYKNILAADVNSTGAISIPIGDEDIRFTQTHLAELQEIIKSGKK